MSNIVRWNAIADQRRRRADRQNRRKSPQLPGTALY
jgi:hypothetical protein